jgi:glycosyltransferase involved in cell wall biosynthesis
MKNNYIIITPAKNEEKYIELTIQSVINQTILPLKWVIVDDGSSDLTSDIVKKYLSDYPFITLVQKEKTVTRNFGNKVFAIRRGFEEVKELKYDYYCNLDADVSFEAHYFESLLSRFYSNSRLGICGGRLYDNIDGNFIIHKSQVHSVAGPVQFFRKECYESFGGYIVSPIGFIDGYAEISARMNGWKTRTFDDLKVLHYRVTGKHRGSILKHRFQGGEIEYLFGYSYIYHLIRNIKTMFDKPFFIGYLFTLSGFLWLLIKLEPKVVDKNFTKFVRKEQRKRIFQLLKWTKNES